jgi:serine/threonine protein kinase
MASLVLEKTSTMMALEERRIGNVISGKWRVDAVLGAGAMAKVYAATHRNGARVALKILHESFARHPDVCERLLAEGHVTNAVKHPGIVRVLDDGLTEDGCVFLVMDLLDGRTLEALRLARGGRLSLDEALDVADALLSALEAAHRVGIVHRDVKPQNVLVGRDGSVKLLDFGVAHVVGEGNLHNELDVIGTPSYMSPEQAAGRRSELGVQSDLWSVGATLFTVLTGEPVHDDPSLEARLLSASTKPARSIASVCPDLPPQVAAVIDIALRFWKHERWASAASFRKALGAARVASTSPAEDRDGAPPTIRSAPFPVALRTREEAARPKPRASKAAGAHGRFGVRAVVAVMMIFVAAGAIASRTNVSLQLPRKSMPFFG